MNTNKKRHHSKLRREREELARQKGTHTPEEWNLMLIFFNHTCCCCMGDNGFANVEKDHIVPIYQGGSDHIKNLQPLCAKCNSSKGPIISDWRPQLADFLNKVLPEKYTNPF